MPASACSAQCETIWTIGHSTRPLEEFVGLLEGARIRAVADVRRFAGSRKYPQYGKEALAAVLAGRAIDHHWLPALGGRRRVLPDSPNTAWRNASFRGYADYMSSAEFALALDQQLTLASKARTAIVCAEGLVALSSLDDRRCVVRARHRGCAHPRRETRRRASDDITHADRPRQADLCCGGARIASRARAGAQSHGPGKGECVRWPS
jgi:hypothetical protein